MNIIIVHTCKIWNHKTGVFTLSYQSWIKESLRYFEILFKSIVEKRYIFIDSRCFINSMDRVMLSY